MSEAWLDLPRSYDGLLRKKIDERISALRVRQTKEDVTPTEHTILLIRIDELERLKERWFTAKEAPLDYTLPGAHHDNACERRSGHEWPYCHCKERA